MTPAIQLDRVSRVYGTFAALRTVSFSLQPGASAVISGENGAGKSTLLRLVAGLVTPTYGTVRLFGAPARTQLGRIAYMSHAPMLYDELTGPENLRYFAALQPSGGRIGIAEALRTVGLDPELTRRVGEYSQGMRQRCSLARVLLAQPDILLLDEPFSNLDAASARRMVEVLAAYTAAPGDGGEPRTLLLTTHQAELARPLARTVLTLDGGRLVSFQPEAAAGSAAA